FTATSSMTWNWSNTAHTGIDAVIGGDGVTNILDDANYQGGGASGSLSLSLPAAMVPTGYTVTLTDQASGPALSTSTTIQ
ncbi:MAG: hypothetical protein HY692_09395, partial [Cyanobacteria bacterium NC_groundwater_1444_Ag_S-0.65um_54_12]|nr:hypothetical protein [Cyanobacteria bacterium NC_groundwater_1444_Ag_S-0.65um_54_12]